MSPSRPVRAAVVGAGLMGRWHADALARADARLVAVADHDPVRAQRLAARHRGARAVPDLGAAIAIGADVVHLCTPTDTHEVLAEQALLAGLHVLVEKPLAETAAATERLLGRAEASGLLLCPTHQFLYQPGAIRARQSLRAIGPLLHVDALACSAGADGRDDAARDRIAAEILPHPLSLLARLGTAPLTAAAWQVQRPRAGEVRATATLGAVSVSILVSMAGRPMSNALRLIGEGGTIRLDLFHGFGVLEHGTASRAYKVARPLLLAGATLRAATTNLAARALHRETAYPGLLGLIECFYRAARGEAEPPISSWETLQVASARDALVSLIGRVAPP